MEHKICGEDSLESSSEKLTKKKRETAICPICKKTFTRKHKNKIYCSTNCYRIAAKKRNKHSYTPRKKETKICVVCGESFTGNANKIYCSKKCARGCITRTSKVKPKEDLKTVADKARILGLSYGEYV
ncbi:MAG: hypothetical protein RSC97_09630, partial [Eubacterium sp.]